MPSRNRYVQSEIQRLYQRQTIDVMLYTFVEAWRIAQPSVSLKESVGAFLHRWRIAADLYDIDNALVTYYRVAKDVTDAEKTH